MYNKWNIVTLEDGIEPAMIAARRMCIWSAAQETIDDHLAQLREDDQQRILTEMQWEIEREVQEQSKSDIN